MIKLPSQYQELEDLLNEVPINKRDGSKGLLGKGELYQEIKRGVLPTYDLS